MNANHDGVPALFVGVDIAARSFAACLLTASQERIGLLTLERSNDGYQQLADRLDQTRLEPSRILVVVEATGAYWMGIVYFLHRAGFTVSLVNPYRVRRYADSQGLDNKTDPMDAALLAAYGLANHSMLRLWHEPPIIYERVYQLLNERYWLTQIKVQDKNRSYAREQRIMKMESVEGRSQELRKLVKRQIDQIEREVIRLMKQDTEWADSARRLQSINGVAELTAAWVLCTTQNFEFFDSPQQVVKYAGLAPRVFESGESIRKRKGLGRHGHRLLRQALFMGALNAIRYNVRLKQVYERMVRQGKPKKLALLAVARRLLELCFIVVKNQTYYDPKRNLPPEMEQSHP